MEWYSILDVCVNWEKYANWSKLQGLDCPVCVDLGLNLTCKKKKTESGSKRVTKKALSRD